MSSTLTHQEITEKALEIISVLEKEYGKDSLVIALGTALILAIKMGTSKEKLHLMVEAVYGAFEMSFGKVLNHIPVPKKDGN